jgi:hypothetical protein
MDDAFVIPRVGPAKLEDRLIDYDGPVLFTVRTENGGRYIGFLADEEGGQSIYWLAPIADAQYSLLLRGEAEVRQAFAESDLVEVRRENESGVYLEPVFIDRGHVELEALPQAGYKLSVTDADTALSAGFIESARVLAARVNRAVTRLVFDYGKGIHEAPAKIVARIILDTQNAVDAIAFSKEEEKKTGPIPMEVTRRTSLGLRPILASSLAIELVAEEPYDLFTQSIAGESLDTLTQLLEARGDTEKLRPVLNKLPKRAIKWYKRLVDDLTTTNANVTIETAGLKRERRVTLCKQELPSIRAAIAAIDSTITDDITFVGELIGYDKDSGVFHMRNLGSIGGPEDYRGKTTTITAIEFASRARISGTYAVHIVRYETYDKLNEEPIVYYELTDIDDP